MTGWMHCNNGAGDEVFAPKTTADAVEGLESRLGVLPTAEDLEQAMQGKADIHHSHPAATPSSAGFMSGEDKKKLDGLSAPLSAEVIGQMIQDALQADRLARHPVGSLYFTVGDEDPAQLFGGKWVKLDGKFIRAVSSGAGEVAGSNSQTLSVANLPNQQGVLSWRGSTTGTNFSGASGVFSNDLTLTGKARNGGTQSTDADSVARVKFNNGGHSAPFSVMPEHICVYAWKRTK